MKFEITYFYGPQGKLWDREETFADIKNSGMTLVPVEQSTEKNKEILKTFEKYGLKAIVSDIRICSESVKEGADIDSLVSAAVNDYKDFKAVSGYNIIDEPSSKQFATLRKITDAIRKYAPGKEVYINLFPNYASQSQLQNETYYDHIEEYMQVCKPSILSYDHYHFCVANAEPDEQILKSISNERERDIYLDSLKTFNRGGFFDNLEIIRNASLKYNTAFMLIVLVVEHGCYRYLTEAEIRWEVFQSIAYGGKRLSYFTYGCPEYEPVWKFREAMIDEEGNKRQHYYDVQKINADLINIGRELENTVTKEVFHIGEEKESVKFFTQPYGGIEKISGGKATLGFFENGSVLIANKDFARNTTFEITFTSKNVKKYDKQKAEWTELQADKIELCIAAGDAELFMI